MVEIIQFVDSSPPTQPTTQGSIQAGGVAITNTGHKTLTIVYLTGDTYTVEPDADYSLNAPSSAIDLQMTGKSIGKITYENQNSILYEKGVQVSGRKITLIAKTQE